MPPAYSGGVKDLLEASFRHALQVCSPDRLLHRRLPDERPALILAVGKAAHPMAMAACAAYPGVPWMATPPRAALGALAPAGEAWPAAEGDGQVWPGSHPLPDEGSVRAAEEALRRAAELGPDDLLLVLVSGGGSALWCAPWGIDLAGKRALTEGLLRAGADIHELNAVRKHLSRIKGGRLAVTTVARVHALLLSDVPGDDPSVIASGPTVADPSTFEDALAVLDRYGVGGEAVRAHLRAGVAGELPESPEHLPDDRVRTEVIGSNATLLQAMAGFWEARGWAVHLLGDHFTGEAKELALHHARVVRQARQQSEQRPLALLSGGEATVTVRGHGRGGRNLEFALALLQELGEETPWGLSAGSDGLDGNSGAAGAFLTPDAAARAATLGLWPAAYLAENDAASFFGATGDLLVTGPTQHNLNDCRVLLLP